MNTCPTCKNPIINQATQCEWCGCKIDNKDDINLEKTHSKVDLEIIELCRNGNILHAVKLKKDNSSLDLKDAVKYVEDLCRKEQIPIKVSGCFIATACYENYDAPEVIRFRYFRDEVLDKSFMGRHFISIYYFLSPAIANYLKKSNISKKFVKVFILNPMLKIIDLKNRN